MIFRPDAAVTHHTKHHCRRLLSHSGNGAPCFRLGNDKGLGNASGTREQADNVCRTLLVLYINATLLMYKSARSRAGVILFAERNDATKRNDGGTYAARGRQAEQQPAATSQQARLF
jgi:hypothetical protein